MYLLWTILYALGSLLFQQKLVPLELRLAKASGSKISGANEFHDAHLQLGQQDAAMAMMAPMSTKDFFAAAQFLELSQDERLAKPSFESFTAGYELQDDSYEIPAAVAVDSMYGHGPQFGRSP